MAAPLTIVIFGASGDLTARKLVPALEHLYTKGRLPLEARMVGVARTHLSDEQFRSRMKEAREQLGSAEGPPPRWDEFAGHLFYVPADATAHDGLAPLQRWLHEHEGDSKDARRLYYLAVAPQLYPRIAARLAEAGMNDEAGGWRRLIIEKPFGRDLASARELNRVLHEYFREEQIYRIDHYLGKETVQNLLVFRFANAIFEPVWNHQYIDHVQITVAETVPVGRRGDYYDTSGVLRDMIQSHLMQVMSMIAMEAPAHFSAAAVRNEKAKVLEAVPILSQPEAAANMACGQYTGYLQEPGVAANSRTPTYAALRLAIDNWRWQGVPFYLRSGKALAQRYSEVLIQFRRVPHMMFNLRKGDSCECNRLAICIQPDEGIHLHFQSKVPDEGMKLRGADLEFHFRDIYGADVIPEAYERLLQDAIHGDATLFMRSDEIEAAWAITDPFIGAQESGQTPPPEPYAPGSDGPPNARALLERDGRQWLSLCHH